MKRWEAAFPKHCLSERKQIHVTSRKTETYWFLPRSCWSTSVKTALSSILFVLQLLCESASYMQELQIQAENGAVLRALKHFMLLFR